jgi:hypothetical protein
MQVFCSVVLKKLTFIRCSVSQEARFFFSLQNFVSLIRFCLNSGLADDGLWTCVCKYENFGAAQDCSGCFLPRPGDWKKIRAADDEKKATVDMSDLAELCADMIGF